MLVIKRSNPVQAFQLGAGNALEQKYIQSGLIVCLDDGTWEIKTREALDQGEIARIGDYVKIDSIGMPYPTDQRWFEDNHTHLEGDWYQQKATPRLAWQEPQPHCPELQFLLERGLLTRTPENTFSAFLWNTWQTAAADAVIIFDNALRDAHETLTEVAFHFVAKEEFDQTYQVLEEF